MINAILQSFARLFAGKLGLLALAFSLFVGGGALVLADDCDNWDRMIIAGTRSGDTRCYLRVGGGATTKQLGEARDYDYFLLYLGYSEATTTSGASYTITLSNTSLRRPKIVVTTSYDEGVIAGSGNVADKWYDFFGSTNVGLSSQCLFRSKISLIEYQFEPTCGSLLSYDVTKILSNYFAVPVGSVVATNNDSNGDYTLSFTPPDRGAYVIGVSNWKPSMRRRSRVIGSYSIRVRKD